MSHPLLRDALTRNPLFWPITWLVVGIAMLFLPLQGFARYLLLSGLFYGAAYLAVGVAVGFRYFYWTELSVQLALAWQLAFGLPGWRRVAGAVGIVWLAAYAFRYLPLLL